MSTGVVPATAPRARVPSCSEATQILQRFIDAAFGQAGTKGRERPRFSIPARPDHDDDLLLSAFITRALETQRVLARVRTYVSRTRDLFDRFFALALLEEIHAVAVEDLEAISEDRPGADRILIREAADGSKLWLELRPDWETAGIPMGAWFVREHADGSMAHAAYPINLETFGTIPRKVAP